MEVHHHPHVEKKNFKEYFLEFLMIFLAVTMGFIAENIRENISENKQAGELAKSLYQEVFADSIHAQQVIKQRLQKEESLKLFGNIVSDSDLVNPPKQFYSAFAWSFFITTAVTFEPNDGVLNQLKNSGTLRYFRSMDVQSKIGELGVDITKIRERQQQEYNFAASNVRPFILKYFDFKLLDSVLNEGNLSMTETLQQHNARFLVSRKMRNLNDFNKSDALNLEYYYRIMLRSSRQSQFAQYVKANHELLQMLRNEYDVSK
ncbi:MAG: hypothetical protein JST87_17740 [Bacteroidetes bacterium]|nr:hypothetical protein [Bacteroidota bacterium]